MFLLQISKKVDKLELVDLREIESWTSTDAGGTKEQRCRKTEFEIQFLLHSRSDDDFGNNTKLGNFRK